MNECISSMVNSCKTMFDLTKVMRQELKWDFIQNYYYYICQSRGDQSCKLVMFSAGSSQPFEGPK